MVYPSILRSEDETSCMIAASPIGGAFLIPKRSLDADSGINHFLCNKKDSIVKNEDFGHGIMYNEQVNNC